MSQVLSLIIDPGGIEGVREGINLRIYPNSQPPLEFMQEFDTTRTGGGVLSSGGFGEFMDFSFTAYVSNEEYLKLMSLYRFNKERRKNNQSWETVVYNLVTPYSEESVSRSRYKVPGTDVISSESLSEGLTRYVYWVALQGLLDMSFQQRGSLWLGSFQFSEGTRLTSDMEQ